MKKREEFRGIMNLGDVRIFDKPYSPRTSLGELAISIPSFTEYLVSTIKELNLPHRRPKSCPVSERTKGHHRRVEAIFKK